MTPGLHPYLPWKPFTESRLEKLCSTTDQDVLLQKLSHLPPHPVLSTAQGLNNRPGRGSIAMPVTAKSHTHENT